ncbi:MAG: zf-TFIIB domain-containing protein [Candidatus Xenobium sp.]|jgi:Zn-finger nucleic acid-binding protein|nr:zf-TFIIB domain-containing protein [Burkholderiales bacterium]
MPVRCPACRNIAMTPEVDSTSGLEIDTCPECGGTWFDSEELSRFLEGGTLKQAFLQVADVEPLQSVGFTLTTRARGCPRCRIRMEERMFSDVTLDICPRCQGLFFDDGELRRVLAKYEKGEGGDALVREQLDRGYGRHRGADRPILGALTSFLRRLWPPTP